jgi:alginate O-acetyltransferase complex protein AlgI
MALGVACLFGVDLPPNFDNPYRAVHIGQFWERWHISLSTWFRYYLFSPLSRTLLRRLGSRRKDSAQALATLATMTLVGLWHGAAWTFVLWGLYHGLLLTINTWLQRRGADRLPPWLQRLGLVVSVLAGWALFLSPDASALANLLGQMAGLGGLGAAALPDLLRSPVLPALLVGIAVAFSGVAEGADLLRLPAGRRNWVAFAWGLLAALSLLWMGASANFLYMQF